MSGESPSSSMVTIERPLVVQRLELLFNNLERTVATGPNDKYKRLSWILRACFDEIADDMSDRDTDELEQWLAATGRVVQWIGTGNFGDLPDEFRESFEHLHALSVSKPVLELEPASVTDSGTEVTKLATNGKHRTPVESSA